jgi:hypothetical protein
MTKMTKKQFEDQFSLNVNNINFLRNLGLEAKPCDCGWYKCKGWILGPIDPEAEIEKAKQDLIRKGILKKAKKW